MIVLAVFSRWKAIVYFRDTSIRWFLHCEICTSFKLKSFWNRKKEWTLNSFGNILQSVKAYNCNHTVPCLKWQALFCGNLTWSSQCASLCAPADSTLWSRVKEKCKGIYQSMLVHTKIFLWAVIGAWSGLITLRPVDLTSVDLNQIPSPLLVETWHWIIY